MRFQLKDNFLSQEILSLEDWDNEINTNKFYEYELCEKNLRVYAELGGLASGSDVEFIFSKISDADTLIEIGGGYGRVIKKLIELKFQGEITAIESSKNFYDKLNKEFNDSVKIYHNSILNLEINLKFDAVLSMWSGISDFTKTEQQLFINKLAALITENGQIIIDTSVWNLKPLNAKSLDNQYYIISSEESILYGYIPTYDEMINYARNAGLKLTEHIEYETDKKRKRLFYIFQREK
jgi:phospholipid N-methyltransferase